MDAQGVAIEPPDLSNCGKMDSPKADLDQNIDVDDTEKENDTLKEMIPLDESNSARIGSPRRVRDIHLDGTADNMPDVDPYMLDEKDLDIQSDAGGQAGSISDVSVRSWKSLRTPRHSKTRSAGSSAPRSSIASRARQIKDHEGDAFLSIDLAPDAGPKPEASKRGPVRSSMRSSQHSLLSVSSSGLISHNSARSSSTMPDRFNNGPMTGRKIVSAASFSSPIKSTPVPNYNVKMPFKHAVNKPVMRTSSVPPGQALTERTALATHVFNKVLREQKPSRTVYVQGKLLKARLKPMEPVQITSPTIDQCRGIIAETRSYSPCDSRTFQRWKAIMSGAQVAGDVMTSQDLKDRASICESVHRTSEASTPEATMDLFNDFDDDFGEEELLDEMGEVKILNGDTVTNEPERTLTSVSLPNSRQGPAHCEEGLANITGPDFQIQKQESQDTPVSNEEDDVADKSEPVPSENGVMQDKSKVNETEVCSSESVISNSNSILHSDKTDIPEDNENMDSPMAHFGSKRPHSATYPQESQWTRPSSLRPKTAVDPSRKAVRFADELKLTPRKKLGENVENKAEAKENGVKGKSSCRPHSLDSGFHDRDDNEKGGNHGKGNTFLTQESVQTSKSTSQVKATSSQQNGSSANGTRKNKSQKKSKPQERKMTYHFRYSTFCSDHPQSLLQEVEQSRPVDYEENVVDDQVNVEENDSTLRPMSASISYKSQPTRTAKKNMDMGKLKQRLDARFAAYKKKKKTHKDTQVDNGKSSENGKAPQAESHRNTGSCNGTDNQKTDDKSNDFGVEGSQVVEGKDCTTMSNTEMKDSGNDNNDQADLKSAVGKFFEDTDYSKFSRVTNRPPSASSRKAKAYKILKSKTRAGSGRPFSASTYSDREIIDRKSRISSANAKKDLRPNSAQIFAEKTNILSKHGLIGHTIAKTRPDSAKQRPSSASSSRQGDAKKSDKPASASTKDISNSSSHVDDNHSDTSEQDRTSKPRIKSAGRVTFAEEAEYDDGQRPNRKSSAGKMRASSTRSLYGSSQSIDSHNTASTLGYNDDNFDADQMWEELPSDHSDDDADEGIHHLDEDDYFMSKFALLETQFELTKVEIEGERMKCQMDFEASHDNLLLSTQKEEKENYNEYDMMSMVKSEPTSIFLTHENEVTDLEETGDTGADYDSETGKTHAHDVENKNKDLELSAIATMAQYQREELKQDTVISSSLYKKTNRYVEVPKNKCHGHRPASGQKKDGHRPASGQKKDGHRPASGQKKDGYRPASERGKDVPGAKVRKNPIVIPMENADDKDKDLKTDVKEDDMKVETNDISDVTIENTNNGSVSVFHDNSQKGEGVKLVTENLSPKVKANVNTHEEIMDERAQSQKERLDHDDRKVVARQVETRKQLEKDYPYLTSLQKDRQEVDIAVSGDEDQGEGNVNGALLSTRSVNEDENLVQKAKYEELLQAYRQFCMESTDDDDEDDEEETEEKGNREKNKRITQPKRGPQSAKSSRPGGSVCSRYSSHKERKSNNRTSHKGFKGGMLSSKQRPSSAATTDSGLDSDSQSNLGDEGLLTHVNQSEADLLRVEVKSLGVKDVSRDQSQGSSQLDDQSGTRCALRQRPDSGVSVDRRSSISEQPSVKSTSSSSVKQENAKKSFPSLEVIAQAKQVTKPKRQPKEEDMTKLCQVPPLCFRLNARPPSGYLYYFAYGPAMNPDRLTTYLGCEKVPPRFWALLFGFDLVFNMKGSEERENGGFPNLEYNPKTSVEGCIYQLTPGQLDSLDKFIGYPQHYEHVVLPTWMSNCPASDDLGVAQYCVPAVTYIAHDHSTWQEHVKPNDFALSQCVKAADILTPAYKDHLSTFSSTAQGLPLAITAA